MYNWFAEFYTHRRNKLRFLRCCGASDRFSALRVFTTLHITSTRRLLILFRFDQSLFQGTDLVLLFGQDVLQPLNLIVFLFNRF